MACAIVYYVYRYVLTRKKYEETFQTILLLGILFN